MTEISTFNLLQMNKNRLKIKKMQFRTYIVPIPVAQNRIIYSEYIVMFPNLFVMVTHKFTRCL